MRTALITDLLLLENHLPWRVFNCLLHLTSEADKFPLPKLTLKYFEGYTMGTYPQANAALENKHLLDFLGNCLQGSSAESAVFENYSQRRPSIPSVTELDYFGIRFKLGGSNDVCNGTFRNGFLTIPPLSVQENGESLFRNLRAYAQLEPSNKSKLISYFVLLDDLIKCEKDLALLNEKEIIANFRHDR
ncbi:uncharacterized protein LOC133713654 [Rosa rugosa]|uniref:uncharacterized protein LOC133713654 n=1 Tax=Rosa rugosa TaxID=74645 RepID=UPI002B40C517|nr:uncharacterized protein LOC133713654 [Rosa rugosa]